MERLPLEGKLSTKETDEVVVVQLTSQTSTSDKTLHPPPEGVTNMAFSAILRHCGATSFQKEVKGAISLASKPD